MYPKGFTNVSLHRPGTRVERVKPQKRLIIPGCFLAIVVVSVVIVIIIIVTNNGEVKKR